MKPTYINQTEISAFGRRLLEDERSAATIEKYTREARRFAAFLGGRAVTKSAVAEWKEAITSSGCSPSTANVRLTALSRFLDFIGRGDCSVKRLRLQRRVFRDDSRSLTRKDYEQLTAAAESLGRERLALLMETICSTGIRVSEVRYITVEAASAGRAEISLKGKIRTILLPGKLCRKLLKYAKKQKIASGEVFLSKSGKSLSRKQIWADMKSVCGAAGVSPSKVFPHNLRHLFALCFYKTCRDVVRLADVLGHSSIDTTRIYLISSGREHVRTLERLGLVS
ncbi:MAG TPA: tyrosine-type recombinase/integrase [Firmicutes bacterium]|nr:tyrosine-type recombinase/integrase [Bacillota bacterium]